MLFPTEIAQILRLYASSQKVPFRFMISALPQLRRLQADTLDDIMASIVYALASPDLDMSVVSTLDLSSLAAAFSSLNQLSTQDRRIIASRLLEADTDPSILEQVRVPSLRELRAASNDPLTLAALFTAAATTVDAVADGELSSAEMRDIAESVYDVDGFSVTSESPSISQSRFEIPAYNRLRTPPDGYSVLDADPAVSTPSPTVPEFITSTAGVTLSPVDVSTVQAPSLDLIGSNTGTTPVGSSEDVSDVFDTMPTVRGLLDPVETGLLAHRKASTFPVADTQLPYLVAGRRLAAGQFPADLPAFIALYPASYQRRELLTAAMSAADFTDRLFTSCLALLNESDRTWLTALRTSRLATSGNVPNDRFALFDSQ